VKAEIITAMKITAEYKDVWRRMLQIRWSMAEDWR